MDWQLIETAPKDGREILGAQYCKDGTWIYGVMHWDGAIWADFFEEAGTNLATHWAPITPPETKGA
jgi:hypothetical protein